MEERKAWINWSRREKKWILRLWIDDKWEFSMSWSAINPGTGIDYVNDNVLCEIAQLQYLGYDVKVTH